MRCLLSSGDCSVIHLCRSYDALVGVTTHDFFDALSDDDSRDGVPLERRDRMLQTFVRNQYTAHLREILLTLQNEYTDWAEEEQTPKLVREQVSSKNLSDICTLKR